MTIITGHRGKTWILYSVRDGRADIGPDNGKSIGRRITIAAELISPFRNHIKCDCGKKAIAFDTLNRVRLCAICAEKYFAEQPQRES